VTKKQVNPLVPKVDIGGYEDDELPEVHPSVDEINMLLSEAAEEDRGGCFEDASEVPIFLDATPRDPSKLSSVGVFDPEKHPKMIDECLEVAVGVCSEWECEFLESINRQQDSRGSLTPKQITVLNGIYTKVCESPK